MSTRPSALRRSAQGRSDWTRPDFRAPGMTVLEGVASSSRGRSGRELNRLASGRGVLVTGSNMSGKSTFLQNGRRQRGPGADDQYLFCAGVPRSPVPCAQRHRRADDLLAGKSYYIAEVEGLLELVRASDSPDGAPVPARRTVSRHQRGRAHRLGSGGAAAAAGPHGDAQAACGYCGDARSRTGRPGDGPSTPITSATPSVPTGLIFGHRLRRGPATTRNAIALLDCMARQRPS